MDARVRGCAGARVRGCDKGDGLGRQLLPDAVAQIAARIAQSCRIQIFRNEIGGLGSPCACSLIGAAPWAAE
jgi:hypothetical protein